MVIGFIIVFMIIIFVSLGLFALSLLKKHDILKANKIPHTAVRISCFKNRNRRLICSGGTTSNILRMSANNALILIVAITVIAIIFDARKSVIKILYSIANLGANFNIEKLGIRIRFSCCGLNKSLRIGKQHI